MSTVPLPEDWEVKSLSEVSTAIQYGHTAKASQEEIGPRMLRITDIQDGTVNWSDVPFCAIEEESKSKYLLRENDLVFARTGATVGKSYLIRGSIPESVYASYLIRVRLAESLDPKYIAYFFQSSDYWRQISESQAGIGQPNVNGKKLAAIRVPLAPLEQQESIVAEIEKQFSRLDEAVANLKRVKANLKRYNAAVLKAAVEGKLTEEWRKVHPEVEPASKLLDRILAERCVKWEEAELAKMEAKGKAPKNDKWKAKYKEPAGHDAPDLPELPEGWVSTTVDAVCRQIVDCPHSTPRFQASGVPCVDTTWMTTEGLAIERARYVDEATYQARIARLEPMPGDIVFAREGTIGTAVLIPQGMKPCLGQRVMLLRANTLFLNGLLKHFLHSETVKRQYRAQALGSTVSHINVGDVKAFKVPLPPIAEQQRILTEVDRYLSLIRETETQVNTNLQRAERLRQSILSKAFSGQISTEAIEPMAAARSES